MCDVFFETAPRSRPLCALCAVAPYPLVRVRYLLFRERETKLRQNSKERYYTSGNTISNSMVPV